MSHSAASFLFDEFGHQPGKVLCQGGVTLSGQVHKVDLVEFAAHGTGIGEVAANEITLLFIIMCQLPGLGDALFTHGGSHGAGEHAFFDGGRRNYQNIGLLSTPALGSHSLLHQPGHADADAGGAGVEPVLAVVGAQHNHQQVHILVALEAGIDVVQTVQPFVDGFVKTGGAAGQTLFNYQIVISQLLLQQAGPALVLIEADAAVGTVSGVRAVAMGIGIAEADNELFNINIALPVKIIFIKIETFLH